MSTVPSTHVDAFFQRFPAYAYNASRPVVREFGRLARRLDWDRGERRARLQELRDAVALQFNAYYGTRVDDINAWRDMCAVLGINNIPDDLSSCRKLVKGYHANIYDYIEAKRLGRQVRRFESVKALAKYSYSRRKVFPKENAKAGGLLKYLLRPISLYAS